MTVKRFLWDNFEWIRPIMISLGYDLTDKPDPIPEPVPDPKPDPIPEPKPDPKPDDPATEPEPEEPKFEVREINYSDKNHISSGFVWKPESDSDKKLVVLMPKRFYGNMVSATLGSEVRSPVPEPYSDGRQVFRFKKSGAAYGNNISLVIKTKQNKVVTYSIPVGGNRYENVVPSVV